jgi:DNA-binding transcriptional regulator YiaG
MTDPQITPDTTIYIIGTETEPQWYAATETPEEAVAHTISAIGISLPQITDSSFRVSKIAASEFAGYKGTLKGMRRAEKHADTLRTYDHEKAMRLSDVIEAEEADAAMRQLETQLDNLVTESDLREYGREGADIDTDTIKSLRRQRSQSQTEFGLELGDYSDSYAQKRVSHLESGEETPTAAERRTLQRIEEGQI